MLGFFYGVEELMVDEHYLCCWLWVVMVLVMWRIRIAGGENGNEWIFVSWNAELEW
jgi:hypothetical protein